MKKYLLACVLFIIFLSSCGSQNQNGSSNFNTSGYPIVKNKITLRVMAPGWNNPGDYNQKKVIKDYENKTNIHIDWDLFDESNGNEKLRLMFESHNMPDIFLMSDVTDADSYGIRGALYPVENLLKEYAPNIMTAINKEPDSKKLITAIDGHIYTIPSFFRSKTETLRGLPFINKKWLDKLGLAAPTTPEELYTVLKAFKAADLNENGLDDEIPMILHWEYDLSGIGSFFAPWGVSSSFTGSTGDAGPFVVKNDKEILLSTSTERYKEAVTYFHQLYAEGLLSGGSFTTSAEDIEKMVDNGKVGLYCGYSTKYPDTYVPLLPLKKYEQGFTKQFYGIFTNNYISAQTKYPKEAMRWMNGTADPDESYIWNMGPEGVNIKKNSEGKYEKIAPPEGVTEDKFRAAQTYYFPVMGIYSGWIEEHTVATKTVTQRESYIDTFLPYTKSPYTSFCTVSHLKIDPGNDNTVFGYLSDLTQYAKEKEIEFITQGNVDEQWDAHLKRLKDLKAFEIKKLYDDALTRWNNG